MEEASEAWARRETRASAARAMERIRTAERLTASGDGAGHVTASASAPLPQDMSHSLPASTAAGSESVPATALSQSAEALPSTEEVEGEVDFKGWLMRKGEGMFSRDHRRYFVLDAAGLRHTDRPFVAAPAVANWERWPADDFVSVEVEDEELHLVLRHSTVTLAAVANAEALAWARAIGRNTSAPVRLSHKVMHLLNVQQGAVESDDPAERDASADLHALIDDLRTGAKAFAASSVVMAGFLFKMRSHLPRVWQKRYVCQRA